MQWRSVKKEGSGGWQWGVAALGCTRGVKGEEEVLCCTVMTTFASISEA